MAALLSPLPPAHPVSINDIDRSPNATESFQDEILNTHVSYGLPCLSTGLDLPKVGEFPVFNSSGYPFVEANRQVLKNEGTSTLSTTNRQDGIPVSSSKSKANRHSPKWFFTNTPISS